MYTLNIYFLFKNNIFSKNNIIPWNQGAINKFQ